jgi:hypothetical protein
LEPHNLAEEGNKGSNSGVEAYLQGRIVEKKISQREESREKGKLRIKLVLSARSCW